MTSRSTIQFAVRCDSPSGGALKLLHYYEHALASEFGRHVALFMPGDTVWRDGNPWKPYRRAATHSIHWDGVAVAVISGWGWDRFIPKRFHTDPPFRVVYVVQSFDRIDPGDSQFRHLSNPAIRLCVSTPLERELRDTRAVNGPIYTIPAGLDPRDVPGFEGIPGGSEPELDILIVGWKRKDIANSVRDSINRLGLRAELLTELVSRGEFLERLSAARVVVCLPANVEGFYLPALEAMAAGAVTVCPDVRGNDYCANGVNCLKPEYTIEQLTQAAKRAAEMSPARVAELRQGARATAIQHDLAHERTRFQALLHELVDVS